MFTQEPLHHFDDWDDFENSHPEITVVRENEIIVQIEFPLEAEGVTCIIVEGNVYFLQYHLPSHKKTYTFRSKEARKSLLYELISSL